MCEYIILEDYKMKQYIYNEQNGLWYELWGDYYIPCLELPTEKEERHIGVWGQRHLRYIREHKKALYTSLLAGCIPTLPMLRNRRRSCLTVL